MISHPRRLPRDCPAHTPEHVRSAFCPPWSQPRGLLPPPELPSAGRGPRVPAGLPWRGCCAAKDWESGCRQGRWGTENRAPQDQGGSRLLSRASVDPHGGAGRGQGPLLSSPNSHHKEGAELRASSPLGREKRALGHPFQPGAPQGASSPALRPPRLQVLCNCSRGQLELPALTPPTPDSPILPPTSVQGTN